MRGPCSILLALAACSGGGKYHPLISTGAVCPPASTLTYDNFGKPFMERYCTRCHASALHGSARHGAPYGHDMDTLELILNVHEHVDQEAAAGPDSVNEWMPDDGLQPTLDERYQLGEWLACEVAKLHPPDAATPDAAPPDAGSVPDAQLPDAQ